MIFDPASPSSFALLTAERAPASSQMEDRSISTMTGVIRRGWPASLVQIADVIGDEAALKLVERLGGARLRVPKRFRPTSLLAATIGFSAATALANALAGEELEIPTIAVRSKKLAILEAIEAGAKTQDIARQFRVTPRYIRYLRKITAPASGSP